MVPLLLLELLLLELLLLALLLLELLLTLLALLTRLLAHTQALGEGLRDTRRQREAMWSCWQLGTVRKQRLGNRLPVVLPRRCIS